MPRRALSKIPCAHADRRIAPCSSSNTRSVAARTKFRPVSPARPHTDSVRRRDWWSSRVSSQAAGRASPVRSASTKSATSAPGSPPPTSSTPIRPSSSRKSRIRSSLSRSCGDRLGTRRGAGEVRDARAVKLASKLDDPVRHFPAAGLPQPGQCVEHERRTTGADPKRDATRRDDRPAPSRRDPSHGTGGDTRPSLPPAQPSPCLRQLPERAHELLTARLTPVAFHALEPQKDDLAEHRQRIDQLFDLEPWSSHTNLPLVDFVPLNTTLPAPRAGCQPNTER